MKRTTICTPIRRAGQGFDGALRAAARPSPWLMLALALCAARPTPAQEPTAEPPRRLAPPPSETLANGLCLALADLEGGGHQTAWLALPWRVDVPAEQRLVVAAALRAALPAPTPTAPVEVDAAAGVLVAGVTAPAGDADAAVAALLAAFTAAPELADAELAAARDRALLRADDLAHVLPGPILRDRARRALARGDEAVAARAAAPERIAALDAAAVRAALAATLDPRGAVLAVVGAIAAPDAVRERAAALAAGPAAPTVDAAAPPPGDEPAVVAHPLVNAPFAVVAVPAPRYGDADFLPFLIGAEVVRLRAWQILRPDRGGEYKAEFPPLGYDFTQMPELLFVGRRGRDGDDLERVRSELDSFVAGVRTRMLGAEDIRAALGALREQLRLPPFAEPAAARAARTNPSYLHQRGRTLAWFLVNGWPADLFGAAGSVRLGAVQEALIDRFAGERTATFALIPQD